MCRPHAEHVMPRIAGSHLKISKRTSERPSKSYHREFAIVCPKLLYSRDIIRALPGDRRRVASARVDRAFSTYYPTNSDVSHFWHDIIGFISHSYRYLMDPAVNISEYLFRCLFLCVPANNLWCYSKEINAEFPLDSYLRPGKKNRNTMRKSKVVPE